MLTDPISPGVAGVISNPYPSHASGGNSAEVAAGGAITFGIGAKSGTPTTNF